MKKFLAIPVVAWIAIILVAGAAFAIPLIHYNLSQNIPATVNVTEAPTYTLTVNTVGTGTVNVSPDGPYPSGTSVTLTAVDSTGWKFDSWSGGATGSANPTTITITGDTTVTATFVEDTVTENVALYNDPTYQSPFSGTLSFGTVEVGQTATATLYFDNTKINPATVTVVATGLPGGSAFNYSASGNTLSLSVSSLPAGSFNFSLQANGTD